MTEFNATPDMLYAMLAKAEEMLSTARRNMDAKSFEDVASRAYYAAFHAISAVLCTRGLTYSSHSKTSRLFVTEM